MMFKVRTKNLDSIKLIIVVSNICLIQDRIINFLPLWFTRRRESQSVCNRKIFMIEPTDITQTDLKGGNNIYHSRKERKDSIIVMA